MVISISVTLFTCLHLSPKLPFCSVFMVSYIFNPSIEGPSIFAKLSKLRSSSLFAAMSVSCAIQEPRPRNAIMKDLQCDDLMLLIAKATSLA